jgi:hypothetical protein
LHKTRIIFPAVEPTFKFLKQGMVRTSAYMNSLKSRKEVELEARLELITVALLSTKVKVKAQLSRPSMSSSVVSSFKTFLVLTSCISKER